MRDASIEAALPTENIATTKPGVFQSGPLKACKILIQKLSTNTRRRDPPSSSYPKKTKHVRLITIGPSHYCEKVRWALDILEGDPRHESPIYYTEDAHPPLFQSIATLEASNNQASMTPMVLFEHDINNVDNTSHKSSSINTHTHTHTHTRTCTSEKNNENQIVMYDSQKIVQHFCPFLYPPKYREDILRLESYFGTHLGATARCIIYHSTLGIPEHTPYMTQMLSANASSVEKILFEKVFDKGISSGMKKVMNINHDAAQESLCTVRKVFEEVSDMLKDTSINACTTTSTSTSSSKKKFIMDNDDEMVGFTAADLAFSALASPLIQPPELELIMPPPPENNENSDNNNRSTGPENLLQLRDELRNTVAGKHVLEMYRTQRIYPKLGGGVSVSGSGHHHHDQGVSIGKRIRLVQPKVVNRDIRTVQAIKKIVCKL